MSTWIYIVLIILLIVILAILAKYNKLITLLNRVRKSQANIEVQLKKRFDLIPNIVETVKGYTKHEKSTLTDIVKLRDDYDKDDHLSMEKAGKMNNKLNKLIAKIEAYPELKANEQFLNLQHNLSDIEEELSDYRIVYNEYVNKYNTAVETVPTNIVASLFGFKKCDFFQADEDEKENIKVEL